MNPCRIVRLAWNPLGWTRGVRHSPEEGGWVEENLWAAEDWNFATSENIDGELYGYTQGIPGVKARSKNASRRWDLLFFAQEPSGRVGVVGFWRNALLLVLDDEKTSTPVAEAWKRMGVAGIVERRARELEIAFGQETRLGISKAAHFRRERAVRWTVNKGDIQFIPEMPPLPDPYRDFKKYHRFSNAFKAEGTLDDLLAALAVPEVDPDLSAVGFFEFPKEYSAWEGRVRVRVHAYRERDTEAARKARQAAIAGGEGCRCCRKTWDPPYGSAASRLFDVHHLKPLGERDTGGEETKATDLVFLCALCHRAAHATGVFHPDELRKHIGMK